ncbi:MAG: restriction endonuclease subunit S [Anaerolineae bacterium]
MRKLTAAEQRFIDNALLIAASHLIFTRLAASGTPIFPLAEIADTTSGGTPRRQISEYFGGSIPWIKSGELNDGLIHGAEEHITEDGLQNSSAKVFPKGTLLVALYGATVGKTGILDIDAATNQAVCAITPKTNKVTKPFLFWFLRYKRPEFLATSFGGAQPNISQTVLRNTLLPVPDIGLQYVISSFLEQVERIQNHETETTLAELPPPLGDIPSIVARIDALAARIEEARGLRRQAAAEVEALTNSAARSRLSLTNVPITRLGDWLDPDRDGIQTGPFGAQLSSADFVDEGVPILTIGNVQYHGLDLQDLKHVTHAKARELQRFALSEGDILFARMGTVGRCCVAPSNANGWLINYHIIRVALDKEKADPRYVHWTIRASTDVQEYLGGTIRGATRQGVNSGIVAGLPCRIPPLPEQRRIVAYLDDLQARVDAVKRLQAETQAELDALLPAVLDKAFKGEL